VIRCALDVLDAIVDEKDLALAEQFTPDRLGGRLVVLLADIGEDRVSLGGRGVDDRKVADTGERHLQGARDRTRRQRQDVDTDREPFDCLFVDDPEALFLVDDEDPEVAERDIVRQKLVRPDDDVDRSVGEAGGDCGRLGIGQETREHLDSDRIRGESVRERLQMLTGKDRRRHEHRDLKAVLNRLERGAHSDFCFPESDVATNKAIHRNRALHIRLHLGDGSQLIGGLGVGECLLELCLPRRVLAERVPG
jgi:hypothetical protein